MWVKMTLTLNTVSHSHTEHRFTSLTQSNQFCMYKSSFSLLTFLLGWHVLWLPCSFTVSNVDLHPGATLASHGATFCIMVPLNNEHWLICSARPSRASTQTHRVTFSCARHQMPQLCSARIPLFLQQRLPHHCIVWPPLCFPHIHAAAITALLQSVTPNTHDILPLHQLQIHPTAARHGEKLADEQQLGPVGRLWRCRPMVWQTEAACVGPCRVFTNSDFSLAVLISLLLTVMEIFLFHGNRKV